MRRSPRLVAAADRTCCLRPVIEAAVAAVAPSGQALSQLAAALAADPGALARGAPPVAGRLAAELIARGSTTLTLPACARCGREGMPLYRTPGGGMCKPCTARQITAECAHCGEVKPVAGRDGAGQRICERCRRRDRGHRRCGVCGQTASIAVRARDGTPDICVSCYRMPSAACSACGKYRECNFAASGHPVCPSCSPRAVARCARCGQDRPPQARWPEGPVCDPCYTAALRRRGPCSGCGELRRLVAPPGPAATTCATCAGLEAMCVCADCGIEDKLYEKGRCCRCSLRRRAAALLSGGTGQVPGELAAVLTAICSARNPRTALNWLRAGAGAAILADLAASTRSPPPTKRSITAPTGSGPLLLPAADARRVWPQRPAQPRDEELARAERWLAGLLRASMTVPEHRPAASSVTFATWQVMPRLRRASQARRRPRTYTARARNMISAAVRFLSWLGARGTTLPACRQADIDDWLTAAGPGAADARDFLAWAARQGHCQPFDIPRPPRHAGTAIGDSQRWDLQTWLLHDDSIQATDRVARIAWSCSTART